MPTPPPLPLDERILLLRKECEVVIDEHVDAIAKNSPGVPRVVIRQDVELRARGNPFVQVLYLLGKTDGWLNAS